MPSPITKPKRNARSRRLSGTARPMQNEIPIAITSAVAEVGSVTLVFNQFVSLKGIPQYRDNNGNLPTAAELTSPNTLVLTYGLGPEATGITVPAADPAIRNAAGGYVAPTSVDV